METFKLFFSFSDSSIISVTVGAILLAASSAVVGTFTFLKKKALIGDAVAHAVLPGVCLAFLMVGEKNPLALIVGAFVTGWLSIVIMDFITARSKIKEDTAIALVLSVFFGIGILLLTYIQHSGNAQQSGLESFLFGKAAALVGQDLLIFGIVAVLLILTVGLFFKELKLIAFDEAYAEALGIPTKSLNLLLTSLTVLAVVTGIQAVGVVLMAAMLITPAAAARFWTNSVFKMTIIAAVMGGFSGLSGAYVSFAAPSMPTGPWIVMIISAIALVSFFIAPQRGIISRSFQQRRFQNSMMEENLLKEMYHLEEKSAQEQPYTEQQLLEERYFPDAVLRKTLKRLKKKGLVVKQDNGWLFTDAGRVRGKRVVKLHRLWEVYLSQYVRIEPDHLHEDAETIEHIITPELEARLESMLNYPKSDPHNQSIPY